MPDVALACCKLAEKGVESSSPAQFRDIGFVSHLTDPDGFIIELLQHDFEANHQAAVPQMEYPLGQHASLGQVTLRVSDIEASLHFYQATLGMTLLSVQVRVEKEEWGGRGVRMRKGTGRVATGQEKVTEIVFKVRE